MPSLRLSSFYVEPQPPPKSLSSAAEHRARCSSSQPGGFWAAPPHAPQGVGGSAPSLQEQRAPLPVQLLVRPDRAPSPRSFPGTAPCSVGKGWICVSPYLMLQEKENFLGRLKARLPCGCLPCFCSAVQLDLEGREGLEALRLPEMCRVCSQIPASTVPGAFILAWVVLQWAFCVAQPDWCMT